MIVDILEKPAISFCYLGLDIDLSNIHLFWHSKCALVFIFRFIIEFYKSTNKIVYFMMVQYIVIFEKHIHVIEIYRLYNTNIHKTFQICQKIKDMWAFVSKLMFYGSLLKPILTKCSNTWDIEQHWNIKRCVQSINISH